jgi:tyrosine-protein phosphatase YwqE
MYERIARLISAGALVQATADFFLRERFADGMLALAGAGLVHVLSSDAHSSHGGRPAQMAAAFERLAEVEPIAAHLEWMREVAPRAIVEGRELELPFGPIP